MGKYIPAVHGYSTVELNYDSRQNIYSPIKTPIIGWHFIDGEAEPVTPRGYINAGVEYPDGRILYMGIVFKDTGSWMIYQVNEKQRNEVANQ